MRETNYRTDYSANIVCIPGEGYCWEVRVNGRIFADEILPERSRLIAESMVVKYMTEAVGVGEEVAEIE